MTTNGTTGDHTAGPAATAGTAGPTLTARVVSATVAAVVRRRRDVA